MTRWIHFTLCIHAPLAAHRLETQRSSPAPTMSGESGKKVGRMPGHSNWTPDEKRSTLALAACASFVNAPGSHCYCHPPLLAELLATLKAEATKYGRLGDSAFWAHIAVEHKRKCGGDRSASTLKAMMTSLGDTTGAAGHTSGMCYSCLGVCWIVACAM